METCGHACRLPSGPLHDAVEMARAGVPTAMLFVQSLGGIAHNSCEDTSEEHLGTSLRTLQVLAAKVMSWICGGRLVVGSLPRLD